MKVLEVLQPTNYAKSDVCTIIGTYYLVVRPFDLIQIICFSLLQNIYQIDIQNNH